MRILILNWRDIKNPLSGGAEIITHGHAKAWVKKGHSVTWLTSSFSGSLSSESIDGINIVRRGNAYTVYLHAPIYCLCNKNSYDLVIDEIHGLPFFTPLYLKKPIIAFIHEVADDIWDYMFRFPINKMGKTLERIYFLAYRKVKFWVDCESALEDLEKYGIKKSQCTVINCAINSITVQKLPVKEMTPTFIFVSRLVKMKGIEEVIKAFVLILETKRNAKLWIIGDGENRYIDKLKRLAQSLHINDKINFLGKLSEKDKISYMSKAHVLLHASVKEGWGLVVTEAASQGTPSVVYNVIGLKDAVIDNITGTVLKNNTPYELPKQAVLLVDDKKRYLDFQRKCLKFAKSLNWENATQKSIKMIETYEI